MRYSYLADKALAVPAQEASRSAPSSAATILLYRLYRPALVASTVSQHAALHPVRLIYYRLVTVGLQGQVMMIVRARCPRAALWLPLALETKTTHLMRLAQ